MTTEVVQTKGIFRGLPKYPDNTPQQTALITGANGISGYYMIKVLAENPQIWKKIYCLSRRPPAIPGGLPKNAEFVQCDFLKSADEIGGVMKNHGITHVDHVFFFAYIQPTPEPGSGIWSAVDKMVEVNSKHMPVSLHLRDPSSQPIQDKLLANFLGALDVASIKPKRIMLQTGAKNYAVHNGPTKIPQEESDPRPQTEPNFYFYQEDTLSAWAQKTPATRYTIAMPSFILGAVPNAAMNAAFPLAVYCAVCKHLNEPLVFPAGFNSWTTPQIVSTSQMDAYLEEYLAIGLPDSETARGTGAGKGHGGKGKSYGREEGQGKFNAVDGALWAWESSWPRIAEWYGLPYEGPNGKTDQIAHEVDLGQGPRGYGPGAKMQFRFSTVAWASSSKVQQAWKEIAAQHDLLEKELTDTERVFGFLDGWVNQPFPLQYSSKKVRKAGFHGFVDSEEALLGVFEELAAIKMVPPVPKVRTTFE
ncbi:MAG: hypothetical protein Q9159_004475 [Coniocarpon cinnabarinum]